jgi:pimeloyl-ACP methyl ester carboxylesterase
MEHEGGIRLATSVANIDRLLTRLKRKFRVVVVEYPPGIAHGTGYPMTLDVQRVVRDYLDAADTAGAAEFGILGYSWSGGTAIEIAARLERCRFLYVGGWPPVEPPIGALRAELQRECTRTDVTAERAALNIMYASYYASVEAPSVAPDIPKVLFYGTADDQTIGVGGGSVRDIVRRTSADLAAAGWRVRPVADRDHMSCLDAEAVAEGMGI